METKLIFSRRIPLSEVKFCLQYSYTSKTAVTAAVLLLHLFNRKIAIGRKIAVGAKIVLYLKTAFFISNEYQYQQHEQSLFGYRKCTTRAGTGSK